MKALLFTSDPYEPSGVIGIFETEYQREAILEGYRKQLKTEHLQFLETISDPVRRATISDNVESSINSLTEIDIPVGKFGYYF